MTLNTCARTTRGPIAAATSTPTIPAPGPDPTRGHRYFQTSDDGSQLKIFAEYGTRDANGNILRLNSFRAETFTNNYSTYLRDSWNVSVVPGLVINAGLRWEVQQIFGLTAQSAS